MRARDTTAADLLRRARTDAGLTQRALAARAGVTQSVVSAYESGSREPALPTLTALVDATGADLIVDVRPSTRPSAALSGPLGTRLVGRRARVLAVARRHRASHVRVFGSVARGDERPDSDIDLLVRLAPGTGPLDILRLERDLVEVLDARVDVVPDDGLKPGAREEILAEATPL
jgi:predicted nucleotidyltransferase/DNA-binding XRE family transcriptional regulator